MKQGKNIERHHNLTIVHPPNHKHTLIWVHGLNQPQDMYLNYILNATQQYADCLKIVAPRAPDRFVTTMGKQASSWFDIKFRNEKSFIVPFDEAFSSAQVFDSFQKILKPIIESQSKQVKKKGGKLIIAGFSQGCGMSLHSLYSLPNLIDAAIGISGYLFPITKFDSNISNYVTIIYGTVDDLRPWELTKYTYKGKIGTNKITMVEGMKHQINKDTAKIMQKQIHLILGSYKPKL